MKRAACLLVMGLLCTGTAMGDPGGADNTRCLSFVELCPTIELAGANGLVFGVGNLECTFFLPNVPVTGTGGHKTVLHAAIPELDAIVIFVVNFEIGRADAFLWAPGVPAPIPLITGLTPVVTPGACENGEHASSSAPGIMELIEEKLR